MYSKKRYMTEVLSSIDNVDTAVIEADLSVTCAIADSYGKMAFIMENYFGKEVDMFSIFQEADVDDDDNGSNDADAKKKKSWLDADPNEGVFMKIIKFIPRMIKQLWEFIKKTWNGVVTPKLTETSNKAQSIFDKIIGKDESWVKEHAKELGIAGGAVLTACLSLVAFLNRNEIGNLISKWLKEIKSFFSNVKDAAVFTFDGNTIKTNIKAEGVINTFKKIGELFKNYGKIIKSPQSFSDIIDGYKKISEEIEILKNADFTNAEEEYSIETFGEFLTNINKLYNDITNTDDMNATLSDEDIDKVVNEVKDQAEKDKKKKELTEEGKKCAGKLSAISRVWTASTKFFKEFFEKITNLFKHKDEVENAISGNDNASDNDSEQNTGVSGDNGDDGDSDQPSDDTESDPEENNEDSNKSYKKGDKLSADEMLKLLQSTGEYKKWGIKDGKITNKNGKFLTENIPVSFKSKDAPGVESFTAKSDGYILESCSGIDVDSYDDTSSSWYSM